MSRKFLLYSLGNLEIIAKYFFRCDFVLEIGSGVGYNFLSEIKVRSKYMDWGLVCFDGALFSRSNFFITICKKLLFASSNSPVNPCNLRISPSYKGSTSGYELGVWYCDDLERNSNINAWNLNNRFSNSSDNSKSNCHVVVPLYNGLGWRLGWAEAQGTA
jgi:hypothetical protein